MGHIQASITVTQKAGRAYSEEELQAWAAQWWRGAWGSKQATAEEIAKVVQSARDALRTDELCKEPLSATWRANKVKQEIPRMRWILIPFLLLAAPPATARELLTIEGGGPAAENTIRAAAAGVAAQHARIWRTPQNTLFIEDLGSPAGTLVNGRRAAREWLTPGTTIALGEWQGRIDYWTPPPNRK